MDSFQEAQMRFACLEAAEKFLSNVETDPQKVLDAADKLWKFVKDDKRD